jgi:PAS domain S-box-containing protein
MFKFFSRARPATASTHVKSTIDTCRLDNSLTLLRTTTLELSEAAVSAASVLQDRLKDSEFRFNSTIDHITDLVIIKDGDGRWKTMNHLGQEVFGWLHGEFYDKTDDELAKEFPRFKDTMALCTKTDNIAWETNMSHRAEECVPSCSKNYLFDVIKTPVFHPDGTRKELIVIGRDVTEIREKQQRTKACFQALNSASDMIVIADTAGRIFFCNDKFVERLNLTSYNEVVGERMQDVVPAISNVDEMWSAVESNRAWEGTSGNFTLNILPVMNGAPKPIYYVCTLKVPNSINIPVHKET